MSDSLKEQLMKAGFKETPRAPKKNKINAHQAHQQKKATEARNKAQKAKAEADRLAAIATEKKALKAKIRKLIEDNKIEKYRGDLAHSYLVGKRIKQIFVTESVRNQLLASEIVITRLNGTTYLVPAETGEQILILNPQWALFKPGQDNNAGEDDTDDEYADYQVPDDLQW